MIFLNNFSLSFILALLAVGNFSNAFAQQSEQVTQYGPVTIRDFHMSNHCMDGKVIHALPGETIEASCTYKYFRGNDRTINQIILGYDKLGAQTAIYDGRSIGEDFTKFTLKAPTEPGIYEVRFRYAQAYSANEAVQHWWNVDGAPDERATIGIVVVEECDDDGAKVLSDENMEQYLTEKYPKSKLTDEIEISPLLEPIPIIDQPSTL